jgi:hypothetical protein
MRHTLDVHPSNNRERHRILMSTVYLSKSRLTHLNVALPSYAEGNLATLNLSMPVHCKRATVHPPMAN